MSVFRLHGPEKHKEGTQTLPYANYSLDDL